MGRILALARAEVLHVVRDRTTLAQALLLPIIQLLVLSNAATFELKDTPTYIVDLDQSTASRGLVGHVGASGHFRLVGGMPSIASGAQQLESGDAVLVIVIPHDFERSLVRTGTAAVELSVDAARGSTAGIVQSYASRVLEDYAVELTGRLRPAMSAGRAAAGGAAPRIEVRTRGRYNAILNYRHYMVPGILVGLVTIITTLLSAQNIAREKELGTLEQLNVTPITRGQFIAAKLLPFWALGMIDLAIGLLVGVVVFGVPVRGSVVLLFGVAAIYLLVTLGIGLWISALVETQQQAMFVTFFVVNVYLLMSGLFTPIDSMAPWVQVASQINPVRHFVTIARAILVKGAGVSEIVQPLSVLAVSAVVVLTVAVRQYSKRIA